VFKSEIQCQLNGRLQQLKTTFETTDISSLGKLFHDRRPENEQEAQRQLPQR